MTSITFKFSDVALVIGRDRATGKDQRIALISGSAEITFGRGMGWDIESVTLSGPILHDPDVPIAWACTMEPTVGSVIWHLVTHSITVGCGDEIYDAIAEARQPDPDRQRQEREDARMHAEMRAWPSRIASSPSSPSRPSR